MFISLNYNRRYINIFLYIFQSYNVPKNIKPVLLLFAIL